MAEYDLQAALADQLIRLGHHLIRLGHHLSTVTARYRAAFLAALHEPDTDIPF